MKIIFFGTPQIAVPSLEMLSAIPAFDVEAVFTQPDKKVGRKQTLEAPAVKKAAEELEIKVFQPANKKELITNLEEFEDIDFFVVFAYGMLMPKKVLDMPKYDAINVHTSLLPKYRGASPIQEALLNGDSETGISIMKMSEELDAGDIYLIKRISIEGNDNLESLTENMGEFTKAILALALEDIAEGNLQTIPQNESQATFCRKIEKNDGKVNLQEKTATEILNMIRAYTPWPGVFFEIKGKKLKIINAKLSDENLSPGEFKIEDKTLKIGTKQGTILPQKVQLEGKNEMDIESFLNGQAPLFT